MILIQSRSSKVVHDVEGGEAACGTPIEHGQMVLAAGGGAIASTAEAAGAKRNPPGKWALFPGGMSR
jgi:hypothetical protein